MLSIQVYLNLRSIKTDSPEMSLESSTVQTDSTAPLNAAAYVVHSLRYRQHTHARVHTLLMLVEFDRQTPVLPPFPVAGFLEELYVRVLGCYVPRIALI